MSVDLKKLFILVFTSTLLASSAIAQMVIGEDASFSERIYFGGGFGFSASNYATVLNLSPTAGYMFTNRLSGGVGVIYQYVNYKSIDLSTHNYGGRLFSRYNITPQLFGYGEYEAINYEYATIVGNEFSTKRKLSPALFLGAGYFQPFGNRGGISLMLLFNVIYDDDNSPYPRPYVVRVGFNL